MSHYLVQKYQPLKEISKRAKNWLSGKAKIGGVWVEMATDGQIAIHATVEGKEAEGTLTLDQAKALRTLLDLQILKAEQQ
jgi:hypothetical protein